MSRNYNKTATATITKPYCKVCHDSGKSESVYSSHWVKSLPDKNGNTKIVCPTLLDTECRYCFKLGHTTKFCPVLVQNNKRKEKEFIRKQVETQIELVANKQKKTGESRQVFAGFDSDTEDEVELEHANAPKTVSKAVELTGWAAIVAKPKLERQVATTYSDINAISEPTKYITLTVSKTPKVTSAPEPALAPWAKNTVVSTKKWIFDSDSEDEDEDDTL